MLFQLEHVLIELLLQFLVCIVDTELLKAVDVKRFKAIYIQHTNEDVVFGAGLQSTVDLFHYPIKHQGIEVFGESISCIYSLLQVQGDD